jgi:hypothetical protein
VLEERLFRDQTRNPDESPAGRGRQLLVDHAETRYARVIVEIRERGDELIARPAGDLLHLAREQTSPPIVLGRRVTAPILIHDEIRSRAAVVAARSVLARAVGLRPGKASDRRFGGSHLGHRGHA